MATGTPVVTTCRALSALEARPGRHLLASDEPEEFSQHVLRIMEDRSLQHAIGDAGVTYVRTFHSWPRIASQLANIYQHTLDETRIALES